MPQNDDIQRTVASIAEALDNAIDAGRKSVVADSEKIKTYVGAECLEAEERTALTISFEGPNAPIIARPIHGMLPNIPGSKRVGKTKQDRRIIADCTAEEIQTAQRNLENFQIAAASPDMQQKIAEAVAAALELEQTTPCKVVLEFNVEGNSITPRLRYIITDADSPMTRFLEGRANVKISDYGEWRASDVGKMRPNGVKVTPTAQTNSLQLLGTALGMPKQLAQVDNSITRPEVK